MADRGSPKRIALVADDDVLVARVVATALRIEGWTVLTAIDGFAAMSAIAEHPLSLCIMDRFMPGPALEIRLAEVSRRRPAAAVVVLSGTDDTTGIGSDVVVLRKPVGLDDLRDGIARAAHSTATR